MVKKYCVYKHVAPDPDKRVYIGKTCQLPLQRWRRGYDGNIVFQHAIEEWGNVVDVFEHYILAPNGEDWMLWDKSMKVQDTNFFGFGEACEFETMWIALYDSLDLRWGFNRQSGGDKDYVMSQDYIKYISELRKGWYQGEKNPFYGKTHTVEVKKALSEQAKQRLGEKNPFKGKHHTEESKERNRQAHLGLYDGEKNPFWGQHHTKETRQHLSKLHSKSVDQFDLEGNLIARYPSQLIAAASVGVSVQSLNMNCKGKTKTCAGFDFRYSKATRKAGN